MLKTLDQYIIKIIAQSIFLIFSIIVSILFVLLLLGELKNIGEGDYHFIQAFCFIILKLPMEIYHFFPMIILLGSIVGLNSLTAHNELSIMRASGVATSRIYRNVILAALIIISFFTLMSESLAPGLSYKANVRKENQKSAGQAVITSTGVWLHINNNFIRIQQIIGRQLLLNVTRYQFEEDHHLKAAYFAKKLIFANNEWQLKDVIKTTFKEDEIESKKYDSLDLDLKINSNLFSLGLIESSEMSLSKLSHLSSYLKKNGLSAIEYQFNFWQRLFQPFSTLVMILVALPFVLGKYMHTGGLRIIFGLFVGFIFFIFNALFGQLCIVYQLPAIFAASAPLLIFFAGFIVLYIMKSKSKT